jgi:hypothetical protein
MFLRIMADTYTSQRAAIVRQWETLLASPMLPIIDQRPVQPVQEIVRPVVKSPRPAL